jgi:hypothetical protein
MSLPLDVLQRSLLRCRNFCLGEKQMLGGLPMHLTGSLPLDASRPAATSSTRSFLLFEQKQMLDA